MGDSTFLLMNIDDIPLSEINKGLLKADPKNSLLKLLTDALLVQNNAMLRHFEDDKDSFGELNASNAAQNATLAKIDKKLDLHISEVQDHKVTQDHIYDDIADRFDTMQRSIDSIAKASDPVNQWFSNVTFLKTVTIGIVGFVGVIVAILVGLKTFFKP